MQINKLSITIEINIKQSWETKTNQNNDDLDEEPTLIEDSAKKLTI